MKFTTKQEYLTWRAEWRANYKHLSENIRIAKLENKKLNRAGQSTRCLTSIKSTATEMLLERQASKVRAQQQYIAGRAQTEDRQLAMA